MEPGFVVRQSFELHNTLGRHQNDFNLQTHHQPMSSFGAHLVNGSGNTDSDVDSEIETVTANEYETIDRIQAKVHRGKRGNRPQRLAQYGAVEGSSSGGSSRLSQQASSSVNFEHIQTILPNQDYAINYQKQQQQPQVIRLAIFVEVITVLFL